MVRALVWRHTVGMLLIKDKIVAPVLQGEAAALRHNACKQNLHSNLGSSEIVRALVWRHPVWVVLI